MTDFRQFLSNNALLVVIGLLMAGAGILAPAIFKVENIANMALQFSPLGIVVVGQMLVILVRGLDLSVSSVMATSAVIATSFAGVDQDLFFIVPLVLVMGLLVGLVNGLLVTQRNVSPFLATLATMIMLQGARNAWTQGAPSGNVPPLMRTIGSGMMNGIPNNAIPLVCVAVFAYVLLHKSTLGRKIYIVGGNPLTAKLAGIGVGRFTICAYVLSSVFSAIAGLILSGYVSVVDNWVGKNFELDSIVAAVMGGIALSGGKGGVVGALMGAGILVLLNNAVVIVGLPIHVQLVLKGFIIVLAAALYVAKMKSR